MKLVKITTTTTSNYPFDWNKDTKEQLNNITRENLGNRNPVIACWEEDKMFKAQLFVETSQTYLINIDYIMSFTPVFAPKISGRAGGTIFRMDKECFEKFQELDCRPASSVIGRIEIKNPDGSSWIEDVSSVSWTDINDQEMYEEVTKPVRDYHDKRVSNYLKIGEMLSEK